ncbi:hypothetical protein C0J52_02715 [Blattella germanica]|nr:hypothetical protein C0J52_02715 [Blattella germanica]PSN56788.1 hypothetical protein C0J52_02715 [Blattella germanica]
MEDSRPAKRVLLNNPGGQRYRGRPRARREDGVEEDARRIGVRNWIARAKKTEKNGRNSLERPGISMGCRVDFFNFFYLFIELFW